METVLSLGLALLGAIALLWLNGKQNEYDRLQDKSE